MPKSPRGKGVDRSQGGQKPGRGPSRGGNKRESGGTRPSSTKFGAPGGVQKI